MKIIKKVLSLLVVMCTIVSVFPAVNAHWSDEDIAYLVENGAITEDEAMLQNLDTPITRSQMVKVIVALLDGNKPIEGKEYFTDISAEDTHIAKAAENGFVNGFGDGTFRPNNPITRQDFFPIVGRAYKLEGEATNEFTDSDAIADYAKPYVDALQSIGIVNGYGDGTIRPRGNITIAETLAVMHRTDEHVNANTPKEEEKPITKPGSGSSGGGHSGGSSNSDINPPNINYTLSTTEECDGALTITTDISDEKGISESGWFFMREYNEMMYGEEQVKKAYMPTNDKIDFSGNWFSYVSTHDQKCGGVGSVCILANYHEAVAGINYVEIQPIEENAFTVTENGAYFVYAKDSSGNLTVVRIDVDNIKVPSATFTFEYEEDITDDVVAYATPDISVNKGAQVKAMFLTRGKKYFSRYLALLAGGRPYYSYSSNYNKDKLINEALDVNQYIYEEDGKFALPDFGTYALYMLDEHGNWGISEFEISPPESEDKTPPQLKINAPLKATFPITMEVNTSDDIARVSYVYPTVGSASSTDEELFKLNVNGRKIVTGNSFTITKEGYYFICAMDYAGNCSYTSVTVYENGEVKLPSSPDDEAPTINYYVVNDENSGTDRVYLEFLDYHSISYVGSFFINTLAHNETHVKAAHLLNGQDIDLSKDIDELKAFDDVCGGAGASSILKTYWDATQKNIETKSVPFYGDSHKQTDYFVPTENGAYFIYAKDGAGHLSIIRIDIDNTSVEP